MKRLLALTFVLVCLVTFGVGSAESHKYKVECDKPVDVLVIPDGEQFATLENGDVVDVIDISDGWAMVIHDFGEKFPETIAYIPCENLLPYYDDNVLPTEKMSIENTHELYARNYVLVHVEPLCMSNTLGALEPGEVVYVASQGSEWSEVMYNGMHGYVLSKYIGENLRTLSEEEQLLLHTEKYFVDTQELALRVRKTPGGKVLLGLEKGTIVDLIEITNGWGMIIGEFGNGCIEVAYVWAEYLTKCE